MGLSDANRDALEQVRSRLCSEIKIRHLLPDCIGIITYEESDDLKAIKQDKSLNSEFIRILRTRTDQNFEEFCQLLCKSDSNTAQALGRELQEAARSGNNNGNNPLIPAGNQPPFGSIISLDPSVTDPPIGSRDDQVDCPNPVQTDGRLTADQCNLILNNIGTDWRRLAVNLDMTINVEVIERENRTEFERSHAMLLRYYRNHPTNFTLSVLSKALLAIERRDIVEMID